MKHKTIELETYIFTSKIKINRYKYTIQQYLFKNNKFAINLWQASQSYIKKKQTRLQQFLQPVIYHKAQKKPLQFAVTFSYLIQP